MPPAAIQVTIGMICACSCDRMSRNSGIPSRADSTIPPQVTSWDARSPIARPKNPAMKAASNGRKTTRTAKASALHQVDILALDHDAVAEIDDPERQADR